MLLDAELAMLYGVVTKAFNQAVKRNVKRFPADFLFQLNVDEANIFRSQIVTLLSSHEYRRQKEPEKMTERALERRERWRAVGQFARRASRLAAEGVVPCRYA